MFRSFKIFKLITRAGRNVEVTNCYIYFPSFTCIQGARGGVAVKALRHKPAGRVFDSRCCHWNFTVT
jgi:hypothetical protein